MAENVLTGRGGPGRGQGRSPIYEEPMIRIWIRLPEEYLDLLSRLAMVLGDEDHRNVSAGVRALVDAWRGGSPPVDDLDVTVDDPRTSVTVPEEYKHRLEGFGGGSHSEGLRRLLTALVTLKFPRYTDDLIRAIRESG